MNKVPQKKDGQIEGQSEAHFIIHSWQTFFLRLFLTLRAAGRCSDVTEECCDRFEVPFHHVSKKTNVKMFKYR